MSNHFVNVGRGKGIVTFWKDGYAFDQDVCKTNYQITKISSQNIDVINVYRSHGNSDDSTFVMDLLQLFDVNKKTVLVGDLNICYREQRNHFIVNTLEDHGFSQLVENPTHIEGRQLDHAYVYTPSNQEKLKHQVSQFGQYFSYHDLIIINLTGVSI